MGYVRGQIPRIESEVLRNLHDRHLFISVFLALNYGELWGISLAPNSE